MTKPPNSSEFRGFGFFVFNGIIGLIIEWIDNDFKQSPAYMDDQLIQMLNFHTPKFYLKDR
ncbi:TetR-like C-terminal domain-containing protein [Peribacillus frigoritolerans]|uniref:TetR-like C-terminal domain-containing protein n=1 Tax=Peribacillus frigoritolerans TaxID=450367 RepID=UPI00315CF7D1